MKMIVNAVLVMKDHYIPDAVLLIEDGKIVKFGERRLFGDLPDCETIDAKGLFVGPGLIDIHVHAGGMHNFAENPQAACEVHLKNGTTTLNSAVYFSLDRQGFVNEINFLKEAMKDPACENLQGLYMEGPYMNPKFGANREQNPWHGVVNKADFEPIVEAGIDVVKVWALAPERENILEFVQYVKAKNPAAIFAVGHSEAAPHETEALMPYGLRIGTHHTNATGSLPKYPECRGVCVDETVSYNREIYAELICDSRGIHVDPYMLRLVRKIKGDDRVILISDACVDYGPTPPGYEGVTDINFDFMGEISGSKLTLNVACRNMMKHTGASICDVFRFASYNPSRATNLLDRGEIAVGKRADLIFVDLDMNVHGVLMNGIQKI